MRSIFDSNRRTSERRVRSIAGVALAAAAALGLSACSGNSSALGTVTQATAFPTAKPVGGCPAKATVSMWLDQATSSQEVVDAAAAKAFEAACPAVSIKISYYTTTNLSQKLTAALAGGTAPTLFETTGPEVGVYQNEGVLVDLRAGLTKYDADWKHDVSASALAPQTIDGKLLGFPSFIPGPLMFMYNKATLQSAGVSVPKTLAQLDTASKKLQSAGTIPVSLGNEDKYPGTYWFQYLVARNGGAQALDDIVAGKPGAWSAPVIKKSLVQMRQYATDGLFGTGFDTTGTINGADKTLLFSGKAGFYINGSWTFGPINQADPAFFAKNQLGYTTFPTSSASGDKTVFGDPSEVYAVTKASSTAQQNAAEAYMATEMTSTAYGKARIAIGDLPAVKGLANDFPKTNEGKADAYAYKIATTSGDEFMTDLYTELGTNVNTFEDASASVLNGSISPDEFVSEMNATLSQ